MNLLEEVVLLLAHYHVTCLFLSLLELVFEGLGIDTDSTITDDLLPCIGGNGPRITA